MRSYHNDRLDISYHSQQVQLKVPDQNHTQNTQIQAQNYNNYSNYGVNDYYNYQIIHEPEYFLDFYSSNQGNSTNQIIECSEIKNNSYAVSQELNTQDFYHHKGQNHQKSSNNYHQDEQQNQNLFQLDFKRDNSFSEYLSNEDMNESSIYYQNNIESKIKNQQNQENIYHEHSEETDNQKIFCFSTEQNRINQSKINHSQTETESSHNFKSINAQNCLKNIIHAFLKYFRQMKVEEQKTTKIPVNQLQNFKKQLVRYMKQHSFNYQVVKYLITHKTYKLLLHDFLEKESNEWLRQSKVVDKHEVKEKIQFLLQCIVDPNFLEQLISY